MPQPRPRPEGGKAPHPIAINTGGTPGLDGAPPAGQQPPHEPEGPPPGAKVPPGGAAPQPAPQAPQPSDPGPYLVELATVEALIAERTSAQARHAATMQLVCMALAAGAFLVAAAAYKRAMVAEAEAILDGGP